MEHLSVTKDMVTSSCEFIYFRHLISCIHLCFSILKESCPSMFPAFLLLSVCGSAWLAAVPGQLSGWIERWPLSGWEMCSDGLSGWLTCQKEWCIQGRITWTGARRRSKGRNLFRSFVKPIVLYLFSSRMFVYCCWIIRPDIIRLNGYINNFVWIL